MPSTISLSLNVSFSKETLEALTGLAESLSSVAAAKNAEVEEVEEVVEEVEEEAPAEEEAETGTETEGEDDDFGLGDETEAEEKVTREDVRDALKAYAKLTSQGDAIKILKKIGGAESLPKLAEEKFAAVKTACDEAAKKAKKKR